MVISIPVAMEMGSFQVRVGSSPVVAVFMAENKALEAPIVIHLGRPNS